MSSMIGKCDIDKRDLDVWLHADARRPGGGRAALTDEHNARAGWEPENSVSGRLVWSEYVERNKVEEEVARRRGHGPTE